MSTTVTYQGKAITTIDNDTKILLTQDKWAEDNIIITDETSHGITVETDPIFSASPAASITQSNIINWNNKSTFSGNYNDLTNKPVLDTSLSTVSTRAVENQAISIALNDKASKQYVDTAISNIPSPTTYAQVTTAAAGLTPKLSGSTTQYLNGNGGWTVPVNTTYADATISAHGLLTAADKIKLNNLNYVKDGTSNESVLLGDVSNNTASGEFSVAEGNATIASGNAAHAEGQNTIASGQASHAEGNATTAGATDDDIYSYTGAHAEGEATYARGNYSHAEGNATTAEEDCSHAEGYTTMASGYASHAEGDATTASGQGAHAEGDGTEASDSFAHAEGQRTIASGPVAHAEGQFTEASGQAAHAEGYTTTASGQASHAEGNATTASGNNSHAEGLQTIANHRSQHVIGERNIADSSTASATSRGKFVEIVGNGSASARSNARTLDWEGNQENAGDVIAYGCGGSNPISINSINTNLNKLLFSGSQDGTYTLQVVVTNGVPTYSWKRN